MNHHGVSSLYPYELLNKIISAYFQPSKLVEKIIDNMRMKYGFDSGQIIGIYY